ncbi:hypothetical protein J6590_013602 [Homalodisca vitripennis]|nr:hypothetical protein J6590_013602 [Homalodisca vitripennis]
MFRDLPKMLSQMVVAHNWCGTTWDKRYTISDATLHTYICALRTDFLLTRDHEHNITHLYLCSEDRLPSDQGPRVIGVGPPETRGTLSQTQHYTLISLL